MSDRDGSDNRFVETQDIARLLSPPVDSGSDGLRDELARLAYGVLYPDAPETFDDPELKRERNEARRIAAAILPVVERRVAAAKAEALRDAAKDALNDYAEGRVRGRLWHEWLARRAAALASGQEGESNG